MNRTNIEWVKNPDGSQGYTWNPVTGCLNHDNGLCKGGGFPCYAYKLANGRLKPLYLANENVAALESTNWNIPYDCPFYPRFWEERLAKLQRGIDDPDYQRYIRQKPKGIFVCDMGDLFGIGVPEQWTRRILEVIGDDYNSMHRFYLLTKQPQNLIKFSPFPENAWVGVTATNHIMFTEACLSLGDIQAKVKYISLEPLLAWGDFPADDIAISQWAKGLNLYGIKWLIIGACTGTREEMIQLSYDHYPELTPMPLSKRLWCLPSKIEWVREIVEAADKAGVKVFLKDNLRPLLERQDITDTNFGRLTSLKVGAIKDAQNLPRQRGWYELRQEIPK